MAPRDGYSDSQGLGESQAGRYELLLDDATFRAMYGGKIAWLQTSPNQADRDWTTWVFDRRFFSERSHTVQTHP